MFVLLMIYVLDNQPAALALVATLVVSVLAEWVSRRWTGRRLHRLADAPREETPHGNVVNNRTSPSTSPFPREFTSHLILAGGKEAAKVLLYHARAITWRMVAAGERRSGR